jgi:superkiller protein 3
MRPAGSGCGRRAGIDAEPLRDRLRSTWGQSGSETEDELRRLAESIDVRAQHPATLLCLAWTLRRVKQSDSELRLLRNAQYVYPGDFWLNFELANQLSEQKDHEGAIRFYTAAVSIRPRSTAALNNLGLALRDQKKLDEAIAAYRKAIEIDPTFAAAYGNLGVALRDQNKLDEAIAAYRKAIELDPNSPRRTPTSAPPCGTS